MELAIKNASGVHKSPLHIFHSSLHRWYAEHGRHGLPWRNTQDPYAIYVSEIMLQQTQVATVLERYYFPFLKRFPTLAALAAAPQDEVLKMWQGLGYYNRAINLHKAAKMLVSPPPAGGRLGGGHNWVLSEQASPHPNPPPTGEGISSLTVEQLVALPGIGRNTAHAVAAFAYRQPVAVMEANVRRALSRIFALANPSEPELWEMAALLLDKAEPFDYNQAMMDIGATVCTRRAPRCGECPAAIICQGKDSPESYPAAKAKKTVPVRSRHIVVLRNDRGQFYAKARSSRFLNGLYHFIETEAGVKQVSLGSRRYSLASARSLGPIRQQYSHFTLEADVSLAEAGKAGGEGWHSLKNLEKLPVSEAERRIIQKLHELFVTK